MIVRTGAETFAPQFLAAIVAAITIKAAAMAQNEVVVGQRARI